MAVTTYSGLSTSVFRRLNRPADSAVFDDCIALAEAEINRRLALSPVRPMHTRSTAALSDEYLAAPSDILDIDNLAIGSDPVVATTPQNLQAMAEADDTTGQPKFYAKVGEELRFYPAPDTEYTLTNTYWAKVPALTSGEPTNWLSLAHPDVYFRGILANAYQEYFDEQNAATQAALFDDALEKVLSSYPRRQDRAPLRAEVGLTRARFNIITG